MAQTLKEIGTTGLGTFSGQILDDFMRELRGREGYKRYNEMRLNSPIVAGMLLAIEQSIRGITWQFVADDPDDERVEFLQSSLDNMSLSWNDHITEALTMLPFGYSLFEIVYKRDDSGRLVWRKFSIRGQDTIDRWGFGSDGGMTGAYQRTSANNYVEVFMPIEKLLLYRTRVERGNPEGRSVLRGAWTHYYYLKNIQQVEAIGIERDLAGLPVIKLPEGATTGSETTSDASVAQKMVRNIRNDEQAGITLPYGWELELLSTGGSRQFDTDAIIRRYESRVLMSALAQFLILGQDKVGSLALSSDQTDFFTMSVNATADIIGDTFKKYAMKRLLELNGYDTEGIQFEHSPAGDIDLQSLGNFLGQVASANYITWMPTDEAWLRSVAKLPEADPERIMEEREIKRQQQMEMFRQRAPFERAQEREDQGATMYVSDKAPDENDRRKWEKRKQSIWQAYLAEQERRIISGARKIER
jgi:hypothetical protein